MKLNKPANVGGWIVSCVFHHRHDRHAVEGIIVHWQIACRPLRIETLRNYFEIKHNAQVRMHTVMCNSRTAKVQTGNSAPDILFPSPLSSYFPFLLSAPSHMHSLPFSKPFHGPRSSEALPPGKIITLPLIITGV
jgi:hypothetical protein